jgi:hypothetical protein
METIEQRVFQENEYFRTQLVDLLQKIPGKWVIFLHQQLQGTFDTEDEAYDDAIERFGEDGGFVVAQVAPIKTKYLSAVARIFST